MDNNKCSNLKISNDFSLNHDDENQGFDALVSIWNIQKNLQVMLGFDWNEVRENLGSLKEFINWNEEAIRDEFRELAEAVGGVNSHGTAIWKHWKKNHQEAKNKKFKELTPEELIELKFEWIDLLHFFMNIAIAIDLQPDEIYNMYVAKNKENIERQKRGY